MDMGAGSASWCFRRRSSSRRHCSSKWRSNGWHGDSFRGTCWRGNSWHSNSSWRGNSWRSWHSNSWYSNSWHGNSWHSNSSWRGNSWRSWHSNSWRSNGWHGNSCRSNSWHSNSWPAAGTATAGIATAGTATAAGATVGLSFALAAVVIGGTCAVWHGHKKVVHRLPICVYNDTESKIKAYLTNDNISLHFNNISWDFTSEHDLLLNAREIRCILEGHAPLMLEATGKCVSQPGETKLLEFFAQVRTKTQNSFIIRNPTDSDWKLYPQVATQEPAGASYFSCEKEIAVPAKKEATIQVFYMPLTMTADATGSPSKSARVEKHKGTVFVGTPDGSAVCYELEGEASPPEVGSRMEAKVPCKKKHTQAVPVKNWLHESFAGVVRRDRDPIFAAAQGAAKCPAQAIVILDAGARCKVGFGTNPISELIEFPAVVGRLRVQPVCMITSCVDRDVWVGEEAEEYRAILTLKQPVANGIVSDNREMEWIWRHCYKRLGVEAENHPLLLMESAWLPKDLRYWVLHKLMQDLEIPWLGLMNHATLSLYASGRTTGVVVDCGETGCRAIPVHDGFVISHAVNRSGFTGRDLTERLRRCLAETDRRFLKAQGRTDAERYKEEHCFVALDYEKERENARTALDKDHSTGA
ncbi:unnamed protein product [Effrenium voratum]|uniref:Uncharacterized protein n=1 Tax=Effrenium voratum TaxID=2562239 RepID=A0AA36ND30_9DINO|nr:unnamed protein product [Effrenium voratum]